MNARGGTAKPACRSLYMTNKTPDKTAGADTRKFKMKPAPGSPPGLEVDSKGNPIPFAERTEDDQEKARKAKARGKDEDEVSMKNPEQEAEHPAPMPHAQQRNSGAKGKGGGPGADKGADPDPAGQQGGTH
jgi:hypothetical protein